MDMTSLPFPSVKAVVTADPSVEPVSLQEAKDQLSISGSDHDSRLSMLIEAARRAWEQDTGRCLIQRTLTLKMDSLIEFRFRENPVNSITSVTYFDTDNASQTLSTSVYQLDTAANALRLKVDQDFPSWYERYDAATVTYVAGTYTDNQLVPPSDKIAMLQLMAYWFEFPEIIGADELVSGDRISSYQALVRRWARSSYP